MTGAVPRLLQKLSAESEFVILHSVGILSYCFQYYRVSGVPDSQYSGPDHLNPAIFDAFQIRICYCPTDPNLSFLVLNIT
jgi:hypothetical protein